MMLMMDDAVVVEKAESVEKEHSALAREIEALSLPAWHSAACYRILLSAQCGGRVFTQSVGDAGDHQNDLPADCFGAWYDGQCGGARDSPCDCDGMEQRRPARHKGRPVHGASNIPPQADKQGLHHRVCGYDPARIRRGNRSLNAEKWGKRRLSKSSCIRIKSGAGAFLRKKAAAEKQLRN